MTKEHGFSAFVVVKLYCADVELNMTVLKKTTRANMGGIKSQASLTLCFLAYGRSQVAVSSLKESLTRPSVICKRLAGPISPLSWSGQGKNFYYGRDQ